MGLATCRILRLSARILGICFALFLSMFAFDVFGQGDSFLQAAGGFLIHMIPTCITAAVLIIAWERPVGGAVGFWLIASGYIILFWANAHWSALVLISGTSGMIGLLFLLDALCSAHRMGRKRGQSG